LHYSAPRIPALALRLRLHFLRPFDKADLAKFFDANGDLAHPETMTIPRKPTPKDREFARIGHKQLARLRKRVNGPVRKPTTKRASAMRKAFVRRFAPFTDEYGSYKGVGLDRWNAWQAGAAWQRRQRRPK
jgi:hypothetical protein